MNRIGLSIVFAAALFVQQVDAGGYGRGYNYAGQRMTSPHHRSGYGGQSSYHAPRSHGYGFRAPYYGGGIGGPSSQSPHYNSYGSGRSYGYSGNQGKAGCSKHGCR